MWFVIAAFKFWVNPGGKHFRPRRYFMFCQKLTKLIDLVGEKYTFSRIYLNSYQLAKTV